MVATRAATKRIESGQELYAIAVVPKPPTKKLDGLVSARKRYRGKQRELCQLNLDVLFLLAAYIHPLDLLNLARTCKSLRELLMDKSSTFVWKTARNQVKSLPECPVDLTEPEYANLVFYARCNGCGKYAKKILWQIRRRYCPDCRRERLCPSSSWPSLIQDNMIIPPQRITMDGGSEFWADKEQIDSIVLEYEHSSDKEQFLTDKEEQCCIMMKHASQCEDWEYCVASEHQSDLELRRQKRRESIFERLEQHGYEPEIAHFGRYQIQRCHRPFFKTSKPLTDKEWARMWPEWLKTMNDFRSLRIEMTVFQPRRDLLVSEYANYLASSSFDPPAFSILPHVTDVARFSPFRDIIFSPEGTEMGARPFEAAFEHLPTLVDEWKNQLDAKFAELVEIPFHLSPAVASASPMEASQAPTEKLRLACAVFTLQKCLGSAIAGYPEVLSLGCISLHRDWELDVPIWERLGVNFLEEAPYIVHACGLDPTVATVEDMDNRNTWLQCLVCKESRFMTWKNALKHTACFHPFAKSSLRKSPCWQLVSGEYLDLIQAAEVSSERSPSLRMRCMLCQPSVGDVQYRDEICYHLMTQHGIEEAAIQEGVHHTPVGLYDSCPMLKMDEGGIVTT